MPASICLLLLLTACTNLPAPGISDWQQHQQSVASIQQWSLSGRLNVRQQGQSDTVNLNWQQNRQEFSIRMSSSLGLGAIYLHGNQDGAVLEKSGEEPVLLSGLDELSGEYLGYDFPAAYLLYWVRGLPTPALQAETVFNQQQLLQSLLQTDNSGQRWQLEFERYQQIGTLVLPGRIKMRSQGVQLTFIILDWQPAPTDR